MKNAVKKTKAADPIKTVMGPLWNLFSDPKCWEIIIDSFDGVWSVVGKEITQQKIFKNARELEAFIERLLKHSKKKILADELTYFFHLDDYTRINVVLPPLAMNGPSLVITKLPQQNVTLDDLIKWEALSNEGKKIIESILNSDKGFLVAGNMGSGKTTLLNTLINSIQHPRRIVTLERVPDLIIKRPLLTRIQSQTQKPQEMLELISLAENMRADYVVLSDMVGPEVGPFIDMIRSNSSGIALATGENTADAIKRLVTKTVLSSEGLSLEEASYAIAQVFPYLIFQERLSDGKRIVSSISETVYENGEIKLKSVYKGK